jgi:hypothetical protein
MFRKLFMAKLIVTLLFIGPAFKPGNEHPDLNTAVKHKLISYTITGNFQKSNILKPVVLNICNLKKFTVLIDINSGLELNASDGRYQNMLITKSELIKLNPLEKRTIELYSKSTEPFDMAPDSRTTYTSVNIASSGFFDLAKLKLKSK